MKQGIYRTTTHALLGELESLDRAGARVVSRGTEVRELRARFIRIQNPLHYVLLAPQRNNNIFASIAETLWVLAGRNDVAFLEHYLPRAPDYSDDGSVWRAGYGPRLRSWGVSGSGGMDQVRALLDRFREDRATRRAVAILFDPALDNVSSRDIPCNNWLHAMIRDEKLYLSVATRSNDVMWGLSGINMFEWSVLQRLLAYWTRAELGETCYFIDSLHLYARHFARAERILANRRAKTLYDFGFGSPAFSTAFDSFDRELATCFTLEERMRQPDGVSFSALKEVSDDLLRTYLQLLFIYNRFLAAAPQDELAQLIGVMEESDLKVAAIEFLSRTLNATEVIPLTEGERRFLEYYWHGVNAEQVFSFQRVCQLLSILHDKKTRVYGDSWKKHGELIGIFANITRKYDRLEQLDTGVAGLSDESMLDTVADLATYCIKYLTFLAEHYSQEFTAFIAEFRPLEPLVAYHGNGGFDAVTRLLTAIREKSHITGKSSDQAQCMSEIRAQYANLESQLLETAPVTDKRICINSAATIAIAAIVFLMIQSEHAGYEFELFAEGIHAL